MLMLKNFLFHRLLDRLGYWITLLDTDIDKTKGKRRVGGRVQEGGPHCKIITWLI